MGDLQDNPHANEDEIELEAARQRRALAIEREIQDILAGRGELKASLPETEPLEVREHEAYLIILQARLQKLDEWMKTQKK